MGMWIVIAIAGLAAIGWLIMAVRRTKPEHESVPADIPADCCGAHAVCERDSLLTKTDKIIYFDDEELDILAHRPVEDFSARELQQLDDVFYTLREQDVAGWLHSLQLRDIALPDYLRDAALLIVAERRQTPHNTPATI